MKKLLLSLLLGAGSPLVFGAAFTPGNLVVLQVGDANGAPLIVTTNTTTQVFLNEFTITGGTVQQIALPTMTIGSNHALTLSPGPVQEGGLNRTADGRSLLLTGYDTPVGTSQPNTILSGTVNRVVAVVSPDGTINTTTAVSTVTTGTVTAEAASGVRGVTSDDASRFWIATNNANVFYTTLGGTSAVRIQGGSNGGSGGSGPGNVRSIRIFDGQLYGTAMSGNFWGVATIGTGLTATGTGTVEVQLPANPPMTLGQPFAPPDDFFFADLDPGVTGLDTLWVALEASNTNAMISNTTAGIARYALDLTGTWNYQYTLRLDILNTSGTNFGVRGLTVSLAGTNATLFGVSNEPLNNHLFSIMDTGSNSIANILATAANNTIFRGIDFAPVAAVPEPVTWAVLMSGAAMLFFSRRRRR